MTPPSTLSSGKQISSSLCIEASPHPCSSSPGAAFHRVSEPDKHLPDTTAGACHVPLLPQSSGPSVMTITFGCPAWPGPRSGQQLCKPRKLNSGVVCGMGEVAVASLALVHIAVTCFCEGEGLGIRLGLKLSPALLTVFKKIVV